MCDKKLSVSQGSPFSIVGLMATLGMDPWNLTNSSLVCDQLIGDSSKKYGRIPEVLAINIGLWLVRMF